MFLRFHVAIRIPDTHHFPMQQLYQENKKAFIEQWLSGCLSNIVTGPLLPLPKKEQCEVVVTMME